MQGKRHSRQPPSHDVRNPKSLPRHLDLAEPKLSQQIRVGAAGSTLGGCVGSPM